MVSRDSVTQILRQIIGPDLLAKAAFIDLLPNDVQLKGSPEVSTIALGVSVNRQFIAEALDIGAQYLICHHGLYIAGDVIRGRFDAVEDRLKTIIKNDLTLAGFHYALDAHPEIGNNAQLIKKLDANRTDETYYDGWGWVAEFDRPVTAEELTGRLETVCRHPVTAVTAGPKQIRRVGVCSGGSKPHGESFFEIIDKHLDAIITGEIAEPGPASAEAGKYHYFACGHYATETFGVQALGEKLVDAFGIEVKVTFIETPTPL